MNSNSHPFSQQQANLLESCMIQSRSQAFYENQPESHNSPSSDPAPQTRKFKLQIEQKFSHSEHNKKYMFPREICFQYQELDSDEEEMQKSLSKTTYYTLADQNRHREETLQKLRKSRSDIGVGLFKQALQIEKLESRGISKNKTKDFLKPPPLKVKSIFNVKTPKDKENNLNFQNLREGRGEVSKSKNKRESGDDSTIIKTKKKIDIPRIDILGGAREQPKCFKDLAKLERR